MENFQDMIVHLARAHRLHGYKSFRIASKLFSPRVYMCGSTLLFEEFLLSFGLNLSSNRIFSNKQSKVNESVYITSVFSRKL